MNKLLILSAFFFIGNACSKKLVQDSSTTEIKRKESRLSLNEQGIEYVRQSGIVSKALNVDDSAEYFSLQNALDEEISLKEKLKEGPVILTWYRGGWCPYCNLQLKSLQKNVVPKLKPLNVHMVAISVDTLSKGAETQKSNNLGMRVISDPDANILKSYNVVNQLPETMVKKLKSKHNIDIEKSSGKKHHQK